MLGLKRGTVNLTPHCELWEKTAKETIKVLENVLGDTVCDIQHIGSTSVPSISAKPIIDIVAGAKNKDEIVRFSDILEKEGIFFRKQDERELLFVMGNPSDNFITHHIHVINYDSSEWENYVNFRDYLNACPEKAKEYEKIKTQLAQEFALDRASYTQGKEKIIEKTLKEAKFWRKNK